MTSTSTESTDQEWDNFNLFATTKETEKEEIIEFQGKIPEWLKGTLYRNGPGANEVNDDPSTGVYHAFDGFAFAQKYRVDGASQAVHFRGSFIKSYTYTESKKQGHLVVRQFGTDPCKSILGRFQSVFRSRGPTARTDDTGVTIQMVNNELLALTETVTGNILDSDTLDRIGTLTGLPYAKSVKSEILTITTAHVMYDEKRKMTIGYAGRITSKQHFLDVVFIYDEPPADVRPSMSSHSTMRRSYRNYFTCVR
jgi:carotenoid cleavage dioxygenase-like enzyme